MYHEMYAFHAPDALQRHTLLESVTQPSLCPIAEGAHADVTLEILRLQGGVLLRPTGLSARDMLHLGATLAAYCERVEWYELLDLSGRLENLEARQVTWTRGSVQEVDLTRETQDLVDDVLDLHSDRDEQGLALFMSMLPEVEVVSREASIRLSYQMSPRVRVLTSAVESGAMWEWTTLYGRRALRVRHEGESQCSVLQESEADEMMRWLGAYTSKPL